MRGLRLAWFGGVTQGSLVIGTHSSDDLHDRTTIRDGIQDKDRRRRREFGGWRVERRGVGSAHRQRLACLGPAELV